MYDILKLAASDTHPQNSTISTKQKHHRSHCKSNMVIRVTENTQMPSTHHIHTGQPLTPHKMTTMANPSTNQSNTEHRPEPYQTSTEATPKIHQHHIAQPSDLHITHTPEHHQAPTNPSLTNQ